MVEEGKVVVRLYRIGHGDCFLLAFPGDTPGKPVYVLIDCGYKPGSGKFIDNVTAAEVCADIKEATNGHIDVVIVTHEHQDHINGFTEKNFDGITFGLAWFAWTEDPDDDFANSLRERFKDRLALLFDARNRLAASPDTAGAVARIDDFLEFELGADGDVFDGGVARELMGAAGAAGGAGGSANKRAMLLVRSKAGNADYLRPHDKAWEIPGVKTVRVFPLGPPKDEKLLHSMDPQEGEGFPDTAFAPGSVNHFFASGVRSTSANEGDAPFARRYRIDLDADLTPRQPNQIWTNFYAGPADAAQLAALDKEEVRPDEPWRRIDRDWLYSAESLALDMNNDTNNGSLVLAFELSPGGKVLLFAADAQRGNWVSWSKGTWRDGSRNVDARDLLARTVLYKVGHHGSHNATLSGTDVRDYANLDWMGHGEHGDEFTAMITAVRKWADGQKGWDHPLKSIKDALLAKASGRVFQTDTDDHDMRNGGSAASWKRFTDRVSGHRLFIDYTIEV